jgi:hypothetical protein
VTTGFRAGAGAAPAMLCSCRANRAEWGCVAQLAPRAFSRLRMRTIPIIGVLPSASLRRYGKTSPTPRGTFYRPLIDCTEQALERADRQIRSIVADHSLGSRQAAAKPGRREVEPVDGAMPAMDKLDIRPSCLAAVGLASKADVAHALGGPLRWRSLLIISILASCGASTGCPRTGQGG